MKINILLGVLISMSSMPSSVAVTEDVCVSKVSGEIRIGTDCTDKESVGSRVIPPSKVEIIKQAKEDIETSEAEIVVFRSKLLAIEGEVEAALAAVRPTFPTITLSNYKVLFDSYVGEIPGIQATRPLYQYASRLPDLRKQLQARLKSVEYQKIELKALLNNYKTITCKKGKITVTVSDKKPTCPKGYKRAG